MKGDTIFRIASITKLITMVAAMILVEECRLRLDDSIRVGRRRASLDDR
jgi:CubicO group peptidase (beta-lactamase class C family)